MGRPLTFGFVFRQGIQVHEDNSNPGVIFAKLP